jgi:hypothetical protein
MVKSITWKTKGKANKRSTIMQPARTKEGRKLVRVMVRSYVTHILSNVTDMQIMRFKNNKRFRTSIAHQRNLPLCYAKAC